VALDLLVAGCGGASRSDRLRPGDGSQHYPVDVDLSLIRVGAAVRLDVEGIGRGVPEKAPFEDPGRWVISVRQGDRRLERLVNGSVAVEREDAGDGHWDTTVRFTVVYELRGARDLEVRLAPPGNTPTSRSVAMESIAEAEPEEGSGVQAAAAVDAAIAAEREAEARAAAEAEAAAAKAKAKRKKRRKRRR
jgi:hypothetical protein